jgi:hypothetical protein
MARDGPWLPGHVQGRTSGGHADGDCCRRCSDGGGGRRRGMGDAARTKKDEGVASLGEGEWEERAHHSPYVMAMVDGRGGNQAHDRFRQLGPL